MKFETEKAQQAYKDMARMINQLERSVCAATPERLSAGDLLTVGRVILELRMGALNTAHQIDVNERQLVAWCVSHSILVDSLSKK